MSGDDTSRRNADRPDDLDAFASEVDQRLAASTSRLPGASDLDPALWSRVQREARVTKGKRTSRMENHGRSSALGGEAPVGERNAYVPPNRNWRRASAGFLLVTVVLVVLLLTPGGRDEPQVGPNMLNAPVAVSPEAFADRGCAVDALTSTHVLEMVLDPGQVGWIDDRALFATPPPPVFEFPHTQTWLPESNGMVEMAGGQREVRTPTAAEFRESRLALERYLRCQEEGTNYQLWALESPVEVQRHILTQTLADGERGWPEIESLGLEDVTETMLLETIERLGPERRITDGYLVLYAPEGLAVQSNPTAADAYVADNPDTGSVEYAWIATQWMDPETGEVMSTRGASLNATPVQVDGSMSNLVVMILTFDADRGQWLAEWLVPTI